MRHHPKVLIRNNVACQSDRPAGVKLQLIVLHDTEGANIPNSARDLNGLGMFFDRISTQASSRFRVGSVDGAEEEQAAARDGPVDRVVEQGAQHPDPSRPRVGRRPDPALRGHPASGARVPRWFAP
jgi:hypothetical protein